MRFQEPLDALADGVQAEIGGPQFLPGNPAEGSGVVGGEGGSFIGHLAAEEAVGCVDHKARIFVAVGQGEEQLQGGDFQSRFLAHLAATAVGEGFAWVYETARQVECSLRGWQRAAYNEKFAPLVFNQGNVYLLKKLYMKIQQSILMLM